MTNKIRDYFYIPMSSDEWQGIKKRDCHSVKGKIKHSIDKALNLGEFRDRKNIGFYIMNGPIISCSGVATKDYESDDFAVLFSHIINDYINTDYLDWVVRHELRHCNYNYSPFRYHDIHSLDVGYIPAIPIGFFHEDIEEIKSNPVLSLKLFKNVLIFKK